MLHVSSSSRSLKEWSAIQDKVGAHLGLKRKSRIVELEFAQGLTQVLKLVAIRWEHPAKHHGFGLSVPCMSTAASQQAGSAAD